MTEGEGYIYRVARADEARLRVIVRQCVFATINNKLAQAWSFGAAASWDFVSGKGEKNLYPLVEIADETAFKSTGDFGHAFSAAAEVRWKRRDDGDYDLIVLSECALIIEGAVTLAVCQWNEKSGQWEPGTWRTRQYPKAGLVQANGRSLAYIDYLAPDGAVQFQRLLGEQV